MNEEQFEREKLYQATMNMFQGMLKEGIMPGILWRTTPRFTARTTSASPLKVGRKSKPEPPDFVSGALIASS